MKNISFSQYYSQDIRRTFINKLFFKLIHIFFSLNQVIFDLEWFDDQVIKLGLQEALLGFLKRIRIKVETKNKPKLNNQEAYIFFGNHPTLLDPFTVLTSLDLQKVKLFISEIVYKIGPNFAQYAFPIKNLQKLEHKKIKYNFMDQVYSLFSSMAPYQSRTEAIRYNKEQVNRASKYLSQGGNLLIFPQKLSSKNSPFQKGIGFVLTKAKIINPTIKINLVPFFIDIKRPYWFSLRTLYRFRKKQLYVVIYWGKPIALSRYNHLLNRPKDLSQKIYNDYQKLIRKINH